MDKRGRLLHAAYNTSAEYPLEFGLGDKSFKSSAVNIERRSAREQQRPYGLIPRAGICRRLRMIDSAWE